MSLSSQINSDYLDGLFVFEGPDGVGKTTIAKGVADRLIASKIDCLYLSFPGKEKNTLGNLVYNLHHDPKSFQIENMSPISLQMLHIAAHVDCISTRILPALKQKKTVILDRFWWSTLAYGIAAKVEQSYLDAMLEVEKLSWEGILPKRAFLITRNRPFRQNDYLAQWEYIRMEYLRLADIEKNFYPVIKFENEVSLSDAIDQILKEILSALCNQKEAKKKQISQKLEQRKNRYSSNDQWKNWTPTQPTVVFDTYWRFAAERQAVFFNRLLGKKEPWSEDRIFQDFKFTNAYRASDRVSQFLIRNVIYHGDQEPEELFFRILLFKTFNKIETWKLLIEKLDTISWNEFDFRRYDKVLTEAMSKRQSIYSAAYIMPSGGKQLGHNVKHRNHLRLIENMMKDKLGPRITEAKSMQQVFDLLRAYPTIGDFLAYQYTIDINYSVLTDFSEMSFVVPGPGAKDGIAKCFADKGGLNDIDIIKLMTDKQEQEFERLGINFQNLWGRPLQLIDCQNLFCEVDKYSRIAHPEIIGLSGRTKIKQRFSPKKEAIEYFFPPKWGINSKVNHSFAGNIRN